MEAECQCCFDDSGELNHFSFYVFGSEGIWICPKCRLEITNFIRNKRAKNFQKKLNKHKLTKEVQK